MFTSRFGNLQVVDEPFYKSEGGVVNGVATLDVSAKVPYSQLPIDLTVFKWTLDLTAVLSGDIYPSQSSTIASVTDIVGSPITTILINGSSYTFGDAIVSGDKITVTVDVASVIDLNFTV